MLGSHSNTVAIVSFGSADEHVNLFPDTAKQAESSDAMLLDQQNVKGEEGDCLCLHVQVCVAVCIPVLCLV